jgi:hypothetical protein
MNTLRWILTVVLALLAVGYLAFFVVAGSFRRSFGASETNPLLLALPLLIVAALIWWISPWPRTKASLVSPASLAYPVLLVNEDKIAEVSLDVDELTLRPENTDHIIEQKFHVVDAQGRRFRIVNFRQAEKRPSTLSRVFGASVYNVKRFKVAFDLRPDRLLGRDEVLAQLRDREWTMPTLTATAPALAELFIAYRADRFREYGNARDRPPGAKEAP